MFKHVSISDMSPPVMTMPDLSAMFDTRKDALSKFSVATMARAAIVQPAFPKHITMKALEKSNH
jgi:hypothetical protein